MRVGNKVEVQGVQAQQRLGVVMVDGDVGLVWARGGGAFAVSMRDGVLLGVVVVVVVGGCCCVLFSV